MKGRVVDISSTRHEAVYVKSGIKKERQGFFDAHYTGGNGTYAVGGEYWGTTLDVKIYLYDFGHCVTFDIRDYVLRVNDKKRISDKLLDFIIDQNKGKKVDVIDDGVTFKFDPSQLDLRR